jgi:hypothetical protein
MGGLSAVISVLRLVGGDLVQSVLGRQHENRAEAILDVTSASTSVVGQQFSDGNIASVLVPDPQREAWFILQGSTVLREPGIRPDPLSLEHRQGNIKQIHITEHTAMTISQLLGRCEKPTLMTLGIAVYPVLRIQDDNAISYNGKVNSQMSRKLFVNGDLAMGNVLDEASEIAAQHFSSVSAIGRSRYRDGGTTRPTPTTLNSVNRTALGFEMRYKDISAALTLSEPRSPKLFAFGVLVASIMMYSAFLLTIYFGNRNEALANVLFALIGQAVVVIGMMALVWTIDHATIEYCITLPQIARAAAFASLSQPEARNIFTHLQRIYISQVRRSHFGRYITVSQWRIIGMASAVVVTVGFVCMYLGLRQLRWWTVSIFPLSRSVQSHIHSARF